MINYKKTAGMVVLCICFIGIGACGKAGSDQSDTSGNEAASTMERVTDIATTEENKQLNIRDILLTYAQSEDQSLVHVILESFKTDTKHFISAMCSLDNAEMVLMMLGDQISTAQRSGDKSYDEVINAVRQVELNEKEEQMLTYIVNNINSK